MEAIGVEDNPLTASQDRRRTRRCLHTEIDLANRLHFFLLGLNISTAVEGLLLAPLHASTLSTGDIYTGLLLFLSTVFYHTAVLKLPKYIRISFNIHHAFRHLCCCAGFCGRCRPRC